MEAITVTLHNHQIEFLEMLKDKGVSKSFILRKALDAYMERMMRERKRRQKKKAISKIDYSEL